MILDTTDCIVAHWHNHGRQYATEQPDSRYRRLNVKQQARQVGHSLIALSGGPRTHSRFLQARLQRHAYSACREQRRTLPRPHSVHLQDLEILCRRLLERVEGGPRTHHSPAGGRPTAVPSIIALDLHYGSRARPTGALQRRIPPRSRCTGQVAGVLHPCRLRQGCSATKPDHAKIRGIS